VKRVADYEIYGSILLIEVKFLGSVTVVRYNTFACLSFQYALSLGLKCPFRTNTKRTECRVEG
jgi:hypothetical protein